MLPESTLTVHMWLNDTSYTLKISNCENYRDLIAFIAYLESFSSVCSSLYPSFQSINLCRIDGLHNFAQEYIHCFRKGKVIFQGSHPETWLREDWSQWNSRSLRTLPFCSRKEKTLANIWFKKKQNKTKQTNKKHPTYGKEKEIDIGIFCFCE